jgi:peptide deformylase
VLREPTRRVTSDELALPATQQLIDDLIDTMRHANGAGIAANQIGEGLRITVIEVNDNPRYPYKPRIPLTVVVNPEITPLDDETVVINEGCLSVPGEAYPTGRAHWAKVTGVGLDGEPFEVEGTGFFARCLQHETDHLNGYLYTDRLIGRYKKEAKRMLRDNEWNVPGLSWDPNDPANFDEDDED